MVAYKNGYNGLQAEALLFGAYLHGKLAWQNCDILALGAKVNSFAFEKSN